MGKYEKMLIKLLRGASDNNFDFNSLQNLLIRLDFDERIKASHHIYSKEGIEEIINRQPKQGKAKPYQVKQVRNLVVKYKLDILDDGDEPEV